MSYYGYQAPPYGQPPPQQYGQQPYQHNQQQYQPPPGQYQQQPPPGQYQQQPPLGQYQQPPPGQPPYGAPSPHGQYQQPPPNNYYQQPPSNQYPPPQPSPGGYYQQPPQQPYGAPPPQQQQQWAPPPPAPYGQPQQGYGQMPPQQPPPSAYPPTPPSLGYGPPQMIAWDGKDDATALRKAMKGFGTDEKTLIRVLANLDPLQVTAVRETYHKLFGRNLIDDIKSETSGWFEKGLVALARGPLMHDVYLLHDALDGPGTKEKVLNDVLLGRSNADIAAIKSAYAQVHRGHSLEAKVRGDLSMKTERHFMMVLAGTRNEDSQPVIQSEVDRDVMELYKATEGKVGTDELLVCDIFTHRNDAQLRAIAHAYQQKFRVKLEDVIKKEFSGHMKDALLFQLRHACDKYMHGAMLLEDAMAGMGTKDHLLVSRVVRFHWNKHDMANIRGAFQKLRGTPLPKRIKGETSGDYERLMLACIGEY